jgi:GalNAc5-diNAcBac-PP-undecaprenol beta-1,3-glucosyltransferase
MMKAQPVISAIITTYNRAGLVPRAIESALYQTVREIEVIVVDDASTDDTARVVQSIQDSRICYVRHVSNRGLAAAGRNTGIRLARGEYIAFLDDDDIWLPNKTERQLGLLGKYDMVLCAARQSDNKIKRHNANEVTLNDLRKGIDLDPSSMIVKASVTQSIKFDESLRYGEDWDYWIRLASKHQIGYLDEPLIIYDVASQGRITDDFMHISNIDLERRMPVLLKHKAFFGPYWFRYHTADTLLSYLQQRRDRAATILQTSIRCGVLATGAVLFSKVIRRLRNA